jgi:hypothetical protein
MENLDHPGLGAELQESDPSKRLGEQVCKLTIPFCCGLYGVEEWL